MNSFVDDILILLQGIILKENGNAGDAERMFIQVSVAYRSNHIWTDTHICFHLTTSWV